MEQKTHPLIMLRNVMMHPSWIFFVPCVILSALSVVELGIVSSIVSYIHLQGPNVYHILSSEYSFPLDAIPAHLHLDAGHVSNAAAGLGFFLGLSGMFIALQERRYVSVSKSDQHTRPILGIFSNVYFLQLSRIKAFGTSFITFSTFILFAVFELLLSFAALVYNFVDFNQTAGFTISLAREEIGQHYSENEWAPRTWFSAVLGLPLESESTKNEIKNHLQIMEISQWMLVPIFAVTCVLLWASVHGLIQNRRRRFE
jgi:hypothetical protein